MARLVKDSVSKALTKMAVPMLAGTFAMNMYHLTDTWFVSRLGTTALAAMSFTFPVIMLILFLTRGLSTGAMTVIAHALGRKEHDTAATLTTHTMFLVFCYVCIVTITGLLTIKPLFTYLGARGEELSLVIQYMGIWYWGAIFMVLFTTIMGIIIGAGNAKAASLLIVGGTGLNIILDPIFIFGLCGVPKMGISGAALATVLAQAVMLVVAFYILHKRYQLVSFVVNSGKRILASWGQVLHIGVPTAFSSVLVPISIAVIVKILAEFGSSAVAAYGVARRIEMFAFMIPMTVGMSLVPFVAQNYGAGRVDRITKARKGAMIFALVFGFAIAVVFLIIARPLAGLFSQDGKVIETLVLYIYITCFGYGFLETHRYAGFFLTGIHRPFLAAVLNILRIAVLLIPLSFMGARLFGLSGVFWARFATDILSGIIGITLTEKIVISGTKAAGTYAVGEKDRGGAYEQGI